MVAAVGVGHLVASRCGPAAAPPVCKPLNFVHLSTVIDIVILPVAMNLTWAVSSFLTCLTPSTWGLGSATLFMTSLTHATFSIALYAMGGLQGTRQKQS
jgi:hypothetical protein